MSDGESAFGAYLWGLLPRPFRAGASPASHVRILCEVVGGAFDALRDGLLQHVLDRFPRTAQAAALPMLAAERSMPRLPAEELDAWRGRLQEAWQWHRQGGTVAGLERALRLAGMPGVVREHGADVTTYNASACYDASRTHGLYSWAEFSVVAPAPEGPVSAADLARLREAVRQTKAAHTKLRDVRMVIGRASDDADVADGGWQAAAHLSMRDATGLPGLRYDGSVAHEAMADHAGGDDRLVVSGGGVLIDSGVST